jgi:predicted dehydrogenase
MAAQLKKHIIVEKPLALTLEEANKLMLQMNRN